MEENVEKVKVEKGSPGGEAAAKSPNKANGTTAAEGEQQQTPPAAPSSSSGTTKHTPAAGSSSAGARGWPKGKRRYPKAPGAPKQPLSG